MLNPSTWIYLGLMAYLVIARVIITLVPAPFRSATQAAVFDWPFLAA